MRKICSVLLVLALLYGLMTACDKKEAVKKDSTFKEQETEETSTQQTEQTDETLPLSPPEGKVGVWVMIEQVQTGEGKTTVKTYSYNEAGQITAISTKENDAEIHSVTYAYNEMGKTTMVRVVDEGVEISRVDYLYNGDGTLADRSQYKNGELSKHEIYTYNAQGLLGQYTCMDSYVNGQFISHTFTLYSYYPDGTLQRETYREAYSDNTFDEMVKEYDERGNLIYEDDLLNPGVSSEYTYDENDWLLEQISYHNGQKIKTYRKTYDAAGNVLTEYADCQWEESHNNRYTYDENGNLLKTEYLSMDGKTVNGYHENYYDENGNDLGGKTVYDWDTEGTYGSWQKKTYDENGNLLSYSYWTSYYPHALGGETFEEIYTYDGQNRKISSVSKSTFDYGDSQPASVKETKETWKYDENGNVTEYTSGDQRYQYTYDGFGHKIRELHYENNQQVLEQTWTYEEIYVTPEQATAMQLLDSTVY